MKNCLFFMRILIQIMTSQFLSYTKDIISIIAPIAALVIAALGLQTWKRQLYGKSEYNIAKKLLKATYKYREAIQSVRHPSMDYSEIQNPPKDDTQPNNERRTRYYAATKAYDNRWSKITEARIEIDTELLEAEVLLGKKVKEKYSNLFSVGKKLFLNIRHYLNELNPDSRVHFSYDHDIIYSKLVGENKFADDDAYTNELNKSIFEIENELRPHLNKKNRQSII